jgi:hypothetical protein
MSECLIVHSLFQDGIGIPSEKGSRQMQTERGGSDHGYYYYKASIWEQESVLSEVTPGKEQYHASNHFHYQSEA